MNYRRIITLLIGIPLLLAWCSCSQKYHLKQSKKHLEKAIAKGYELQYDTIFKLDTIRILSTRTDTLFKDVGDTVKIEKERLRIVYKRDTITNEVYIDGECKADTIIRNIPVQVQKPIYIEKSLLETAGLTKWWQKFLFWLFVIVLFALIIYKAVVNLIGFLKA